MNSLLLKRLAARLPFYFLLFTALHVLSDSNSTSIEAATVSAASFSPMIASTSSAALIPWQIETNAIFADNRNSEPAPDPMEDAWIKWDAGNYIAALEIMKELLEQPDSERYLEKIALMTGELYVTEEIAEDGDNPRFSPDGQYFSYETEIGRSVQTHIMKITDEGVQSVFTVQGQDFVFAPGNRHGVLLQTELSDRLEELQHQLRDAAERGERQDVARIRNEITWEQAKNTALYLVDFENETTSRLPSGDLLVRNHIYGPDGTLYFSGLNPADPGRSDIYRITPADSRPIRITDHSGFYDLPIPIAGNTSIVYTSLNESPFPQPPGEQETTYNRGDSVVLHHLETGQSHSWKGHDPVVSAEGNRLAFLAEENHTTRVLTVSIDWGNAEPDTLATSSDPVQHPALSPDGSQLAYMIRDGISWNIRLVNTENGSEKRLTNDIQHELFPHFLDNDRLLGKMGEFRHRRAHIYDTDSKEFHRLFHNNLVRTVSLEYQWEADPDGRFVLVVAERDGDTISPEEGVYLVRLDQHVTKEDLRARVKSNLKDERNLHAHAEKIYRPIRKAVKEATEEVQLARLYDYQKNLYDFGSKHMTQPGNRKAGDYIYNTLKSFGYEPELQWFEPQDGVETANVIATLKGTDHPEVVYILSSHYDSVPRSPGADDNSSGTAVLMETARVLAANPQPATIIFASLTAEESGLLGAREFVRRDDGTEFQVAGVINNDMMGWTRHHRLDNTIRFSNHGIRDVQHSGAILFTDLITYDSRYYRFTDAHVFFDAYGDIIGGIGSYPILGNPNYHQTTDRLETINHRLVREVTRSTTATLMNLSNSPSRVRGLQLNSRSGDRIELRWEPNPESDIDHYIVRYRHTDGSAGTVKADSQEITIEGVKQGSELSVSAVNSRGMKSWDAARTTVD